MKLKNLAAIFALSATLFSPALSTGAPPAPVPGKAMRDGTIHAGVSPVTGKPMYTTPLNAPRPDVEKKMNWFEADRHWEAAILYCRAFKGHGHNDWRLPARAELEIMMAASDKGALAGSFQLASGEMDLYWTSEQYKIYDYAAWALRPQEPDADGNKYKVFWAFKDTKAQVRCVRG